jgi:hypothetical protein
MQIKFNNIYQTDYTIGNIRISIDDAQIPAWIKLLKISKDIIELTNVNKSVFGRWSAFKAAIPYKGNRFEHKWEMQPKLKEGSNM